MHMFCTDVWPSIVCLSGARGGQKGVSDPLGLELEMVVGIKHRSSRRAARVLNCGFISLVPLFTFWTQMDQFSRSHLIQGFGHWE